MTTFPALIPSSRVFTPGEYPATAFNGYSGAQNRVRHSNVFLASQLRLTYKAASEADMLTIWRHYAGTQGNYESFELSPEALSDVSSTDYVPGVYRWIYAGPGVVEDLPCGGHNISLTLETVPPVAASVVGSRFRINLLLATGGAFNLDTSGIAGVIELGLMAGDAFETQPGLSESIELGLTTGDAIEAQNGLNQAINFELSAGAAATTSGISELIEIALIAGRGFEGDVQQGFAGDYDPINWTFEDNAGDGTIDDSGAPASITLVGSNTDSGDTIDDSGAPINTDYTITALQSGIISFNWGYSSEDEEDFDGFGYLLNGLFTLIADNATQGTGFTQFNVNQNDVFGFRVFTVDDVLGAGVAVISDFLF